MGSTGSAALACRPCYSEVRQENQGSLELQRGFGSQPGKLARPSQNKTQIKYHCSREFRLAPKGIYQCSLMSRSQFLLTGTLFSIWEGKGLHIPISLETEKSANRYILPWESSLVQSTAPKKNTRQKQTQQWSLRSLFHVIYKVLLSLQRL